MRKDLTYGMLYSSKINIKSAEMTGQNRNYAKNVSSHRRLEYSQLINYF